MNAKLARLSFFKFLKKNSFVTIFLYFNFVITFMNFFLE